MKQQSSFEAKTIEELLPKYVCHRCVDKVLEYNRKGTFGGEVLFMTIMFLDIHGFSTIAEKFGPIEAMNILNSNFHLMIECIFERKGAILKFIGDGMMVAFGLPNPEEDDVERALHCVINLQKEVIDFQRAQDEEKKIKVGIGMHSGDVVLGNVGNHKRLDFTIIGDAVNVAARLADIARSNEILISDDVLSKVKNNTFKTEFIEDFLPKGKTKKIYYHRVCF